MVLKLPLPPFCSAQLVDDLVLERANGRNKAFFNGLAAEWRERVEFYVAERGNPESIPDWPDVAAHRKKFINLYEHPGETSVQRPIIEQLRDRTLQICPSCGEEGTPNTLDHYLPKAKYPQFAVTPVNLSPMCDICQGQKGNETVDDEGRRLYLHPYFDDFIAEQVLRLTIGRPLNAPENFSLDPDCNLPEDIKALVARHIDGLDLEKRYGPYFRDQYIRLLRLAQNARDKDQDFRALLPLFKEHHLDRGPNAWIHLFYVAVIDDAELVDYLTDEELEEMR